MVSGLDIHFGCLRSQVSISLEVGEIFSHEFSSNKLLWSQASGTECLRTLSCMLKILQHLETVGQMATVLTNSLGD